MIESEYTRIYTGSFIVMRRILDDLEEKGINAIVKDDSESGRLAGFLAPIPGQQELYVHNDELVIAMEIVNTVKAELEL
ncbi:putative signal transducing protein [Mangrovimonas aestuarii]|uniref:putative signal transducing protein n=1 Tax=Mangrovimonas aestuarii TaxID=3018443 RepID=UPI0023784C50|nr:DUF2007 domain-containing protein [Mangrovimonas aestuarii]